MGCAHSVDFCCFRAIGKASSEMRFYFSAPRCQLSCPDSSSEAHFSAEEPLNLRASYLSGQNIYGNAVLATVGYAWKSKDLFCEDVTLCTYYRFFFFFCVYFLKNLLITILLPINL